MALIGTAPVASRYDGIAVGPAFAYTFETQEGIPIDGTNSSARDYAPFVIRLVPPAALLEAAASTSDEAIDLISAAAQGASTTSQGSSIAKMLGTVTATGTTGNATGQLENFVASGQFFTDASAQFASAMADAFTAADIALQVQRMVEAEPLILLVNPSDMSIQHTKLQSFQSRTRQGFVFEAWGADQDTITFSGGTGGFVAGAADTSSPYGAQETGNTSSVSGYQAAAMRDSAAWQNFTALYHFYRNNGYIFDTIGRSLAHLFVGSVAIDYDQWTYEGHIESFSYRHESESPLRVTFELEFKASRIYDRASTGAVVEPLFAPTPSPSNSSMFRSASSGATFSTGAAMDSQSESTVRLSSPPLDNPIT